jgi:hypothetical protein
MKSYKNYKKPKKAGNNTLQPTRNIVPKSMARIRADVLTWKNAMAMAENVENPKMFPYYNLVKDMLLDAHTTSQITNRKYKTTSANFSIQKANGETHEELTRQLQKSVWFNEIISHILDSEYFGYTLIEFNRGNDDSVEVALIPRQNVIPQKGIVLKDYTDDKGLDYRNANEYGTWLLDFGKAGDLGIINQAIPHILFSRFAQSCWSELCEIYGIPPRVMKTNTRDRQALARAEKMMTDMGAAAWFIIDETEQFEWATNGVPATGEVYDGLINRCENSISLLLSGAIIGQDTRYGSRGKEMSSQDILQDLVDADQTMVEQYMNDKVLPALYAIGVLPEEDLSLVYDQAEDLGELWTRTKEILPYKEVSDDWIKEKFGIEVIGNKAPTTPQKLSLDFFD